MAAERETEQVAENAERGAGASRPAIRVAENAARIAFAIVLAWNLVCALQFVIAPQSFAAAYELSGVAGQAAVRGLGIAFLMWNATYPLFIIRPRKHPALGAIILAQQAIGLVGETFLLVGLPAGHEVLAASIQRFIAFDGAGLIIMAVTFIILQRVQKRAG